MQTTIKSVHEIAEENGYRFTGTCNCDGMVTQKFDQTVGNKHYQIRWRKNRYLFRVLVDRLPLNGWSALTTLETFIKQLHETKESAGTDPGTVQA